MASLRRTPVDRPTGAELVRQIASETAELPPTRREPEPQPPSGARRHLPAPPQSRSISGAAPNLHASWHALLLSRAASAWSSLDCCATLGTRCQTSTSGHRPDAAGSERQRGRGGGPQGGTLLSRPRYPLLTCRGEVGEAGEAALADAGASRQSGEYDA
jgi:hypothetical protein